MQETQHQSASSLKKHRGQQLPAFFLYSCSGKVGTGPRYETSCCIYKQVGQVGKCPLTLPFLVNLNDIRSCFLNAFTRHLFLTQIDKIRKMIAFLPYIGEEGLERSLEARVVQWRFWWKTSDLICHWLCRVELRSRGRTKQKSFEGDTIRFFIQFLCFEQAIEETLGISNVTLNNEPEDPKILNFVQISQRNQSAFRGFGINGKV